MINDLCEFPDHLKEIIAKNIDDPYILLYFQSIGYNVIKNVKYNTFKSICSNKFIMLLLDEYLVKTLGKIFPNYIIPKEYDITIKDYHIINKLDSFGLISIENIDKNENTPLMITLSSKCEQVFYKILSDSNDNIINKGNLFNTTPIIRACNRKIHKLNRMTIDELIKRNANVNHIDNMGESALVCSCKFKCHMNKLLALDLIKMGTFVQSKKFHTQPLEYACLHGWIDVVDAIIDKVKKENIFRKNYHIEHVDNVCIPGNDNIIFGEAIFSVIPDQCDRNDVQENKINIFKKLVDSGADYYSQRKYDLMTPIMVIAVKRNINLFRFLIENDKFNFDKIISQKNNESQTIIDIISEIKNINIINELLNCDKTGRVHGNIVSKFFCKLSSYRMIHENHINIIDKIIEHKNFNPDIKYENGMTILSNFISRFTKSFGEYTKNCIEHIISKILENINDIEHKDNDGKTALALACMNRNYHIISILIKRGADVNTRDNEGNTPIIWALKHDLCVAHFLISIPDIKICLPNNYLL
jgi:ankyrin repeat protein